MTRFTDPIFKPSLTRVAVLLAMTLAGCAANHRPTPPDEVANPVIAGSGVTVFAAGDIADCGKLAPNDTMAARSAELIAAGLAANPTAWVLALGDNVYKTGTASEYANCYAPTWGRFKTRTLPAPGNHEYYSAGATGYYDYFGTLAGPDRRGYFSVDIGHWHVISLNSNLEGAEQQAQIDWVEADLARRHAGCTMAYWHHPVFSSGGHGNNEQMRPIWKLLAASGADLILSGHDHDYERFAPQDADGRADARHGMRQFVIGTGGAALTPFRSMRANSATADNNTYGVLKLVLEDSGFEWEFIPLAGAAYHDRGSAHCHG